MKTFVFYKSKYGHAKSYAEMIARELNAEWMELSQYRKVKIQPNDLIIFGSGVYIGKINQIKKALQVFRNHRLIVFACGGDLGEEATIKRLHVTNFTEVQRETIPFFYLPGGMDLSNTRGFTKVMLSFVMKMLEKKSDRTEDEEKFLQQFSTSSYYVDRSHLEPLLRSIRADEKTALD